MAIPLSTVSLYLNSGVLSATGNQLYYNGIPIMYSGSTGNFSTGTTFFWNGTPLTGNWNLSGQSGIQLSLSGNTLFISSTSGGGNSITVNDTGVVLGTANFKGSGSAQIVQDGNNVIVNVPSSNGNHTNLSGYYLRQVKRIEDTGIYSITSTSLTPIFSGVFNTPVLNGSFVKLTFQGEISEYDSNGGGVLSFTRDGNNLLTGLPQSGYSHYLDLTYSRFPETYAFYDYTPTTTGSTTYSVVARSYSATSPFYINRRRSDTVGRVGASYFTLEEYAYGLPASMFTSSQSAEDYAKLSHTLAPNTNAGTATAGSWFTRTLNTVDNSGIAQLSLDTGTNSFYLPSGTYDIYGYVTALQADGCVGRLFNISSNSVEILGNAAWSRGDYVTSNVNSFIDGRILVPATGGLYRLEQIVTTTRASYGQGGAASLLYSGVYAALEIKKINSIQQGILVVNSGVNFDLTNSGVRQNPYDIVRITEETASGVAAGNSTSATIHTRKLNTVSPTNSFVSLTTGYNIIITGSGNYEITASSPAAYAYNHQIRLYDVLNSTSVAYGTNEWDNKEMSAQTRSLLHCNLQITGLSGVYTLQHWIWNGHTNDGLGVQVGFGKEIYSEVIIKRINPLVQGIIVQSGSSINDFIILNSGTSWSTANSIVRCFSGVSNVSGASFSYLPNAFSGDAIQIKSNGNYYFEYADANTSAKVLDVGISLNDTGSANIYNLIPFVNRLAWQNQNTTADMVCKASSNFYLHSGDIIRAVSAVSTQPNYTNSPQTYFYCRKVSN